MKLILGFVGQIASGKGTATEYLRQKHNASAYRFSTILRDVLNRLFLDVSRKNLQKISQALREYFGEDTLAKVMAEDVKKDNNNLIAIDGIRRPDDFKYLKEMPGFALIHISADMEKRYERITKRWENNDDKSKTYEQFKADHLGEAELKIKEIASQADYTIDNNGALEELYSQLDKIISVISAKD